MCEKSQDKQRSSNIGGKVRPVFELSDPPRGVPRNSGPRKTSYRLRPRGDPILFPHLRKNNRKYVTIALKPKPRSMGKVYHFKAAGTNPRATVQMHPIPEASIVKHERGCPFYKPGPPTIQVLEDLPVQTPWNTSPPSSITH